MTGERVERHLPDYSFRQVHEDNHNLGLVFVNDATPQDGGAASEAVVKFIGSNTSNFTYDAETKTYSMRQFNRDFIDANDNSRPTFTNLLVLKTSITMLQGPDGGSGRRDMVTTGSGAGYFICGGKYIEIEWHRANNTAPFRYTHKDGTELELGRGRTYIGIIPGNSDVSFS